MSCIHQLQTAVTRAQAAEVWQRNAHLVERLHVSITHDSSVTLKQARKDIIREDIIVNGITLPASSTDRDIVHLLTDLVRCNYCSPCSCVKVELVA